MKKACIITLYGNHNFGNKLQNYAVQKILEKNKFEVFTLINIVNKTSTNKEKIKKIVKLPVITLKKMLKPLLMPNRYKKSKIKDRNFLEFNKNFMKFTDYIVKSDNINEELEKEYDYFILGSDQVWNYTFKTFSNIMFACFSPKEKNISFAASFGVSEIPKEYKDLYIKGLNNISHISVREEAGANIVKELTGREANVLVDPTMLLTKEEWLKIAKVPKNYDKNKKYILIYFLGKISEKRKNLLEKTANEKKIEIVNILDINSDFYTCGPSEFVHLVNNAEMVCTDSFHACVFSIIFNTSFYVFDREDDEKSMNSRIETLLLTFKLEDRKVNNNSKLLFSCDYKKTYEILEYEKDKTKAFLEKALNINKEK